MAIVRGIHKISDWLDKFGAVLSLIMLAAMVIITGLQIVFRVFFEALTWSEELCRYLLVWSTFVGASCVYKHAGHINITIVQNLFPPKVRKILKLLVQVICAVFFVMMIYYGFIYVGKQGAQLSPAMRIPMSYMYASIPVGGLLMAWHALDAILQMLFVKDEIAPTKEEEVEA